MTKAKKVNFTDEMVATMEAMYTGADNKAEVKAIAAAISKSEPAVRSKLSNMGLYITAAKTTKAGGPKKADVAASISALLDTPLTDMEVEGLVKATSTPLDKILATLTANAAAVEDSDESEESSE